jgi:hypothetical protein
MDPATQTRYLEELAFEIVYKQSTRHITLRAEELANRGVRRVFAIFVTRGEVCEWSRSEGRFVKLSPDSEIVDPTLARPLPVRAILNREVGHAAVVKVLDAKQIPEMLAIKAQAAGRSPGRSRTFRPSVAGPTELAVRLRALASRGVITC